MKVKLLENHDDWQAVKNATMNTVGKEKGIYPSSSWKKRLLLSEHSPIRKLKISWKWTDLKSWVSVHFVRHKFGIEHFVSTQRTDRTGVNRDELTQGELVNHECEANAQAIITISRKRLCNCASRETREAWMEFLTSIKDTESELYSCCVRECVYRNGFCPEFKTCKFNMTSAFEDELKSYTKGLESQTRQLNNNLENGVL